MMPGPLRNARWERFAQELFQGKSVDESYLLAGYRQNRGNASRLKANESVQARLAELQEEAAKQSEVTVASLMAELEHARQHADSLGQLSASVRAIIAKMELAGLKVDRKQIDLNATVDVYAEANSAEEVLIKVVDDLGMKAALALAAAFELPYDEAAIQAMCSTPITPARHHGNGGQTIEWTPPRKQVRREP